MILPLGWPLLACPCPFAAFFVLPLLVIGALSSVDALMSVVGEGDRSSPVSTPADFRVRRRVPGVSTKPSGTMDLRGLE